jgi:hypothetical protein
LAVQLQVTYPAAAHRSELDLAEGIFFGLDVCASADRQRHHRGRECNTARPARERSANYVPYRHEHPASPKTRFVTRIGSYK